MRHLILGVALLTGAPALACPMADAAASAAVDKDRAAAGTKLVFAVEGMKCGSCSGKIAAKLGALPGVFSVETDVASGKTEVSIDAAKIKPETIVSAIEELGYKAKVSQS